VTTDLTTTTDRPATSGPDPTKRTSGRDRRPAMRRVGLTLVVVVLALLPFFLATYPIGIASRVLAFALLVISVDLLTGYTGMPTLGQVAYFGAGAYTAGLVGIHVTDNGFVQLGAAVLVAGLLALVTGAAVVRTTGIVFLMVTLAVGELAHEASASASGLGASNGLAGIPAVSVLPGTVLDLPGLVYWWVLGVFLAGCTIARIVVTSPLGRSMRGVRDGSQRLHALGQPTYRTRLTAFVVAGGIAGAAGAAWVAQARFFSPGDLGFDVAAFALLSVILGGAGTLWGPVLGAVVVVVLRDHVSTFALFEGRSGLLLGLVFVFAVYALPRGIAGIGLPHLLRTRLSGRKAHS